MNPVREAMFACVSADSTLTGLLSDEGAVYHQITVQNAQTPFLVVQRMTGTPIYTLNGEHPQSDLWLVKAVARGASASTAEDIAARMKTDAPLSIDDNTLLGCGGKRMSIIPRTTARNVPALRQSVPVLGSNGVASGGC